MSRAGLSRSLLLCTRTVSIDIVLCFFTFWGVFHFSASNTLLSIEKSTRSILRSTTSDGSTSKHNYQKEKQETSKTSFFAATLGKSNSEKTKHGLKKKNKKKWKRNRCDLNQIVYAKERVKDTEREGGNVWKTARLASYSAKTTTGPAEEERSRGRYERSPPSTNDRIERDLFWFSANDKKT